MTYLQSDWQLLPGNQTGRAGCLCPAGTTCQENVGDKRHRPARQGELSTT